MISWFVRACCVVSLNNCCSSLVGGAGKVQGVVSVEPVHDKRVYIKSENADSLKCAPGREKDLVCMS